MRKLHTTVLPTSEEATVRPPQAAADVIEGPGYRIVVELLNMSSNVHSARVEEVVETCNRIGRLEESIRRAPSRSGVRDADVLAALDELNRLLLRYQWHPYCLRLMDAKAHFKIFHRIVRTGTETLPNLEYLAIDWIVARIDDVRRIRRCQRMSCGKWYWAVRERQKYCADSCRSLEHQYGTEFRRKRADYMREIYRPREKQLEEESVLLAKKPTTGRTTE